MFPFSEIGREEMKKKEEGSKLAFIHDCTSPSMTPKPTAVDFPAILYFRVIFQTTPVSRMQVEISLVVGLSQGLLHDVSVLQF